MNPCPTQEQLQSLLAEELPPTERSSLEAHVEQCSHCQHTLEELVADPRLPSSAPVDTSTRTPLRRLRRQQTEGAEPTLSLDFLAPGTRPDSLGRLGHYEVLEVLGRGGFGIVFRAFDDVLQRVVAIKVLAPEVAATSPARKRFLREARSAAQVRHENVVQIHAVEEEPLPYLVMEFVPGETLQQRLDRTGPLEPAEVVAIGRQVAEGLAAAHAAGLIHRDIKPSNILIEAGPRLRVKITDFGLARAADDASLTQSGVVAGTPLYMSPEQARGEALDHRTDLFSLGSVLYAITSGRPPFRAENTLAVLKRVAEDAPRPIPEIIPEAPAWLCQLIAKLMAKNPDARVQTAAEVSAALEAGLSSSERLASRPTKRPAKGFARKRLWAGGVLAVLAVLGVTGYFVTRPDPQPHVNLNPADNDKNGIGAPGQPIKLPTPEELAARPSAADHLDRLKTPSSLLALAGGGNPDHAPPELVAVLGAQPFQHHNTVSAVCFSPNGRLLATTEDAGHNAKLSPVRTGEFKIWDAETGEMLFSLKQTGDPSGVAFSPDGKHLATGSHDNKVRIWDLEKREAVHTLKGHTLWLRSVAFNAEGDRLLTASQDKTARIWDVASGDELVVFKEHTDQVNDAIFSPDGSLVASAGNEGTVRLWESATGTQLKVLRGHSSPWISRLSFRKDGKRLVSIANQDDNAVVWNVETGAKERILNSKDVLAAWVAWSPDGTCIARCGAFGGNNDNTESIRLYHPETGKEIGRLHGHQGAIWNLAFSADGKRLAGGGVDKRLHLWDMTTGKKLVTPGGHDGHLLAVTISPDGKTLASAAAGADTRIRLWNLATGRLIRALPARPQSQGTLAFSPDGKVLASGGTNGEITFWDWDAGKATDSLGLGQGRAVSQIAFSPDGQWLAFGIAFGETKLYHLATKKLRTIDPGGHDGDGCVAFSPDGKTLATGGSDKVPRLYDVDTGAEVGALRGHEDVIRWVAFRPDGTSVAFGGGQLDRLIRHWGLAPQAEKPALRGHTSSVLSCAWRADGALLASAGTRDGTVRLWNPDATPPQSRAIVLFAPGQGLIHSMALTPEGRHLVTGNSDGTIYVLRLAKQGEVAQVP